MELYQQFAKHIRKTFLSDDRKGEFVSLIVDEQYMNMVARDINVSKQSIIQDISHHFFSVYRTYNSFDDDSIIAIVGLQLYAASHCVTEDGGFSANAYNPPLYALTSLDDQALQRWYSQYQDTVWAFFYKLCKSKGFLVDTCKPRPKEPGRYVQYPLSLAKYTFNREDLRYIASIFNRYMLHPNEEIAYNDFWRIIDIRQNFMRLNSHIDKVLSSIWADKQDYEIAKSQIHNHFLFWDGDYKDPYWGSARRADAIKRSLRLNRKNESYSISILDDTDRLLESILINSRVFSVLKQFYRCKHEGVIVFQKHSIYPNTWDEVRYIANKQEKGIAVVFDRYNQYSTFYNATELFSDGRVVIYEFEYSNRTREFYSEEANFFELMGGLKIGRRKYLEGGAPILRLHKDTLYLLDGQTVTQKAGDYILDLQVGKHLIKFQRKKEIILSIVSPSVTNIEWSEKYTNWNLSAKEYKWLPTEDELGVIGLDFRCYSANKSKSEPSLTRWCQANQNKIVDDDSNITIKLLNNLNRYE